MNKKCKYCGTSFVDRSNAKIRLYCSKKCGDRVWKKENPNKIRESARAYREKNREKIQKSSKVYRENNIEKVREHSRVWARANPDKVKERKRKWNEANRDHINEQRRLKYQSDLEKMREYSREYYRANREKELERHHKHRKFNLERVREQQRIRRKAHPEKMKEYLSRRRAIVRGASAEKIDYQEIYVRDNYTCLLCGEAVEMGKSWPHPRSPSIDHIIPLSKGGTHESINVQLTHLRCNIQKGNADRVVIYGGR